MEPKLKLGDALVKAGLIDELQLKSALGHQKRWGGRIGKCLVDLKFLEEKKLIKFLSENLKFPVVDLSRSKITAKTFELIPRKVAEKYGVVPVFLKPGKPKGTLVLAMSDPMDIQLIDEIKFLTNYKIEPVVALDSAIQTIIAHWGEEDIHIDTSDLASFEEKVDEQPEVEQQVEENVDYTPLPEADSGIELIHDEMDMVDHVKETSSNDKLQVNEARKDDSKIEFEEFMDDEPSDKSFGAEIPDFDDVIKEMDGGKSPQPQSSNEFSGDQTMIMMTDEVTAPPVELESPSIKPVPEQPDSTLTLEKEDDVVEASNVLEGEQTAPPIEAVEEVEAVTEQSDEIPAGVTAVTAEDFMGSTGPSAEPEEEFIAEVLPEPDDDMPEESMWPTFELEQSISGADHEDVEEAEPVEEEVVEEAQEVVQDQEGTETIGDKVAAETEETIEDEVSAEAEEAPETDGTEYVADAGEDEGEETIDEVLPSEVVSATQEELVHQVADLKKTINELRAKIDNFLMLFLMRESGQLTTEEFMEELKKG